METGLQHPELQRKKRVILGVVKKRNGWIESIKKSE